MQPQLVCALYKFVALADYAELRGPLLAECRRQSVLGTLLLAEEGINGTLAGPPEGVRAVVALLLRDPRFEGLELKQSTATSPPFGRMKVKLKREIVTMGVPGIDPTSCVGTYVRAEDWNALLDDPELVLIDTRNDYEVRIGTFRGARDPKLKSFRDFPAWLRKELAPLEEPKVAMFCTGGIRCEKATSLLRSTGLSEVYHLKGGILKYLEVIPEQVSLWQGECFVFDERVAVGHGLSPGSYELCRACREPIGASDRTSAVYEYGVSCPHCHDRSSTAQRTRFAERIKQVSLSERRGESHLKLP